MDRGKREVGVVRELGVALLVAVGWFGSRCGAMRGVSRISDSVGRIRLLRVLS